MASSSSSLPLTSSALSMHVTNKAGKFIGGAAAARHRSSKGNKIVNPMEREILRTCIGHHVHVQERFMAAILRTIPRDIMKSYSFPHYRQELRLEMCERVKLPPLAPLKTTYRDMKEHNQIHASMVLEEARHVIAESLFRRWGKDKIPLNQGIEIEFLSNEKMRNSEHLVFIFRAKKELSSEIKSRLRPGTVVELMSIAGNRHQRASIENVVLGNVVRCTPKGGLTNSTDDAEMGRQIAIMIYNSYGEKLDDNGANVRLVPLDSFLNLTRQFDACTTGTNDLNGEILGLRPKRPVHTIFSYSSDDEEEAEEKIVELDCSTDEGSSDDTRSSGDGNSGSVEHSVADEGNGEIIELDCSIGEGSSDDSSSSGDGNSASVDHSDDNKSEQEKVQNLAILGCKSIERSPSVACISESDQEKSSEVGNTSREILSRYEWDTEAVHAFGYHVPRLNPTQQKAAQCFLDTKTDRITIVQGPPGTGKTTLLVSVICHYLYRTRIEKKSKRLLVCAPTNKAVNVLAVRVLDAIRDANFTSTVLIGDQESLLADNRVTLRRFFVYTWRNAMVEEWERIVKDLQRTNGIDMNGLVTFANKLLIRIKRQVSGLIDDQLQTIMSMITNFLGTLIQANGAQSALRSKLVDEIKQLVKKLNEWDEREVVKMLLAEAAIIFCTLSSAGAQVMKETVAVDDIIVDEAAAATTPELCVGLWLVSNRLLLVGDPHQLPATVNSDYGKVNGLDKSLQDRLMNQCGFHFTMLDIQYRMKKEISSFPFRTFYSGNVRDGEKVLDPIYQTDFSILNKQPYAFVQIRGDDQRDALGSCYNSAECNVIAGLLQEMQIQSRRHSHHGNDWWNVNRVRVITFYQAQVNEIRKRLVRLGLQNVVVSTVDSSQGCEADIVIISFVRSEKIGFLSDYRRLNVALTRAKYQLVCVGDVRTLATLQGEKARVVSQLAQDAVERKCVVDDYIPQFVDLRPDRRQQQAGRGSTGRQRKPSYEGARKAPNVNTMHRREPAITQRRQPLHPFDPEWKKHSIIRGSNGERNDSRKRFKKL